MAATENDKLLKLYELAINEEHHMREGHDARIAFYSGFVTALVAGTIAGLLKASEWYHLAALSFGPVLIFLISSIAMDGTFRLYQRFLEAITIRAKIEQELGLTKGRSRRDDEADFYWQLEPIIPLRHITSRKAYESSEAFIEEHTKKGYRFWTVRLFRGFQLLSILMFIGILASAIGKVFCRL